MSSFIETLKNCLDYNFQTSPFLLINKKGSIPSWLGAISTIIVFLLTLLLCMGDIRELWALERPIVFTETIQLTEEQELSFRPESFSFSFYVKPQYESGNYLNSSVLDMNLYLSNTNPNDPDAADQLLKIDFEECPDNTEGKTKYCISKTQNDSDIYKLGLSLRSSPIYMQSINLQIQPCYHQDYCLDRDYIDETLASGVTVFIEYDDSIFNLDYYKGNNFVLPTITKIQKFDCYIENLKDVEMTFRGFSTTYSTPWTDLVSFGGSPVPEEHFQLVNLIENNGEPYDDYFFSLYFKLDNSIEYIKNDIDYDMVVTNKKDLYTVSFNSIPTVLGAFNGMLSLLFTVTSLILNTLLGYLEGNFYFEMINSFFEDGKIGINFGKSQRRMIKVYDTKPKELNIIESESSKSKENLNGQKDELIFKQEVEFNKLEKCADGMINTIFCGFKCCFRKSQKEALISKFYNQGKSIVQNYIDIIFIMKKVFEFEQVKNNVNINLELPKIISGIDIDDEKDENLFYEKWIKEQAKARDKEGEKLIINDIVE